MIVGYLIPLTLSAQNTQQGKEEKPVSWFYVESKMHYGHPIKYSDSLTSSLEKPFTAEDIRFGFQSVGKHPSQFALKFPNYGVGFYYAQLSNTDTLGLPFAVYSFYQATIFQRPRIRFSWEIDFGLAWHFNVFDKVTNPKNDLISSDLNIIFNLNLNTAIKLSERFDLTASYGLTHFSNGTLKLPNKGLNMYGGAVGLKYHFSNRPQNPFHRFDGSGILKPEKFRKKNELDLFFGIGAKAIKTNKIYPAGSIVADFCRNYGWVGKFGLGVDYLYDGTLRTDFDPNNLPPETKYTMLGIHASHELVVSNLSLVYQLGTYLWKNMDAKGVFFMRVGVRYNISKHLFFNMALKTVPKLRADYIEMGLGIRIFKP
jgi:hypothetical protein